jgi:hypothetical protein
MVDGRRGVVLAAAVFAALAACGGSGKQYVSNDDAGLYVRVPESWQRFDITAENRPESVLPRAWTVVLDASDQPSLANLETEGIESPVMLVQVVPLNRERDGISLTSLRSRPYSVDPLKAVRDGDPNLEIVRYEEPRFAGGYWGTELVINVRGESGKWSTVAHVAMVGTELDKLYELTIRCSSTCFDREADTIHDVIDSWRIEETSS